MVAPILLVPVFSTLLGGLVAVRFRRWVHVLLAFGAGLLLGAAFLDLLPEAIAIGGSSGVTPGRVLTLTLLSFLGFFVIETALDAASTGEHTRIPRQSIGRIAGGMLIFHSFRDGMAIGAAFSASHTAGYAVAAGIAAHDIGDGMNTIILTTAGEKARPIDYAFLLADALAPLVGGVVAIWWFASAASSAALLAVAAGFFIQMAATDFLPQIRQAKAPGRYVVPCVFAGVGLIFVANLLLGKLR
jgi:zinc and cadmium transporter